MDTSVDENKVLLISPHMDDEVLGASNFLNSSTTVMYLVPDHPNIKPKVLQRENERLVQQTGISVLHLENYIKRPVVNELRTMKLNHLISIFEKVLNKVKPEYVVMPYPSYNQDHRFAYDAMITALRPQDTNHFAKKVLLYEQPETFGTLNKVFKPTYFTPISLPIKQGLISIYNSQLRAHRSLTMIEGIARVRGIQSDYTYAEAYEILRWVE